MIRDHTLSPHSQLISIPKKKNNMTEQALIAPEYSYCSRNNSP